MNVLARAAAASLSLIFVTVLAAQAPPPPARHNVIIFVADGLRRGSVTPEDMPALYRIRTQGVDLRNSHSVFPTFTTANASVIATGHGLGDTGDFSNTIYPGMVVVPPHTPDAAGTMVPFLEADDVLATLNSIYNGNYLGETTLLSAAHDAGFNVASIGKLGPAAIQLLPAAIRNELGAMAIPETLIIDDSTGHTNAIPLPLDVSTRLAESGLPTEAPLRTNGFETTSQWSNGFKGNASTPGTLAPNIVQIQWFADVTTRVILPGFVADKKPFVLLFWSRDPDGTQHDQGDSLQKLTPGINGPTVTLALHNADHALQQLLDWLDRHPDIKAVTDIIVTSDHGFATLSRREFDDKNTPIAEPSANLDYEPSGTDKPEPPATLPAGFLAIDLALLSHQRLFDPGSRAATGDSIYSEVILSGEKSHYPALGNGLLGDHIKHLDGSDARLIVAANGGSDLIYVPTKDPIAAASIVHETLAILSDFDYVGGLFVDDAYCPNPTSCPGALPLSSIGLKGTTHLPTPAIVVAFKYFYLKPGDLQSAIQISDNALQEGQGMHGGFGRDQTWNNMAAIGPDFKKNFVDTDPVGNIDITPTIASILGITMPSHGSIKGRVMSEALSSNTTAATPPTPKTLVSAPSANGHRTVLEYQQSHGVGYYDRACFTTAPKPTCN